ncbi:MAG: Na+:solute symporter [Candidatus Omnitrophica bacterium]|nr:Na+:solute symporter [Candidatus Omnitrophota bacterium]
MTPILAARQPAMHWIDWAIVAAFCLASIGIGLALRRVAGASLEAYFVSNRALGWWLAGTSIAATAFSSDTPLLITGMVRRRGIWGVWEVWALGISTMLTVFVFAKLWKRANVMTEVELVELRYSGVAAAFLRGFKALYWGLFYNCYVMGVWPVVGMTKVLQETTGVGRGQAIVACVLLGTCYTSVSGLWGVVLTDAFQFMWAMVGAVVLAIYAVHAVGGLAVLTQRLQGTSFLSVIPPGPAGDGSSLLSSPIGWFLGLILLQWWAWKNTDGGGVVVQRLVSCKDERQAMFSVLWFNIAHYCLRSWPWIITALASILLIPDAQLAAPSTHGVFIDHERAYPRLITMLLPIGMRGVLVASFFAAFLSTLSTQLNWGASYLLNDGYKRFVNRTASERHYLFVARCLPVALAAGAMAVAFSHHSIGASFTWILNLTAGIGPVFLLRWLWWRINPWSEIAAMTASVPVILLRPYALRWLGWPSGLLIELGFMIVGTALVWLPVTLCTPPVDRQTLQRFHARVQPPGWWKPIASATAQDASWAASLAQWIAGTVALLATTIGPLELMVGSARIGWLWCLSAVLGWTIVLAGVWAQPTRHPRRGIAGGNG